MYVTFYMTTGHLSSVYVKMLGFKNRTPSTNGDDLSIVLKAIPFRQEYSSRRHIEYLSCFGLKMDAQ